MNSLLKWSERVSETNLNQKYIAIIKKIKHTMRLGASSFSRLGVEESEFSISSAIRRARLNTREA